MSRLVLFEDDRAGFFEPVALTRSVARLRLGAWTHRERWERLFPESSMGLICREAVSEVERESGQWKTVGAADEADTLFVAAALGAPGGRLDAIRELEPGQGLVSEGRLVAARVAGASARKLAGALIDALGKDLLPTGDSDGAKLAEIAGVTCRDVSGGVHRTLVDLLTANAAAIAADCFAYESLLPPADPSTLSGVHLVRAEHIRVGEGARVDPGVVLDAREGPILIGPDVEIHANSVIQGPVVIGSGSRLNAVARLAGVSLGPVCRIGGEVHDTIVMGFSNKQHDGFLGNSYLGSWVNLGAATDTSDLKNNYGIVTLRLAGRDVDTGRIDVGSLIGDHTKTAIHTTLNTGSVIGVGCNIFGTGFPPKALPSFSWGGGSSWVEYRLDRALGVARTVMQRRGEELSPGQEGLLRRIHTEAVHG